MPKAYPIQGEVAEAGAEKTIVYLRLASGEQPGKEFLEALPIGDQAKLKALMRTMAYRGITNRNQYALVERRSGIYAFKAKGLRLLCFNDAHQVIVLVGGGRINGKLRSQILERATTLRDQYQHGKVAVIDRRAVG
ncbi:MAG: hypothetical protein ACRERC_06465 [Candidatus Binatia bacterium]